MVLVLGRFNILVLVSYLESATGFCRRQLVILVVFQLLRSSARDAALRGAPRAAGRAALLGALRVDHRQADMHAHAHKVHDPTSSPIELFTLLAIYPQIYL